MAHGKDIVPSRLSSRPHPADWDPEDPITLQEAACLFWPQGPLTTKSLRTAVRDGQLAVAIVAGKMFTCPRAVREMMTFERRVQLGEVSSSGAPRASTSGSQGLDDDHEAVLAEVRRFQVADEQGCRPHDEAAVNRRPKKPSVHSRAGRRFATRR